jgi:hypothetical protein
MHLDRRTFLAAGAVALAGCTGTVADGDSDEGGGSGGLGAPTAGGVPTADDRLPMAYGLDELQESALQGAPKDGIPAIDDPSFVDASTAELTDADVVFGLTDGDVVRAYPQRILVWHEIVNDVVNGTNVAVTYCPLTGTAMGFHRGDTTFGVSGKLVNSNLVMYDRATDSWWSQMLGTSIRGEHAGKSLREFHVVWTRWGQWRRAHPDTEVLSRNTGFARDYERDPYGSYTPVDGYYHPESAAMFQPLSNDDRAARKAVVLGARTPDGVAAFDEGALLRAGLLRGEVGGEDVVAVADATYDTGFVYEADGSDVTRGDAGVVVDGETYPADDLPLPRVRAFDAMWFAWAGFYPETPLYE